MADLLRYVPEEYYASCPVREVKVKVKPGKSCTDLMREWGFVRGLQVKAARDIEYIEVLNKNGGVAPGKREWMAKPNFGVCRNKVVGFSHCLPKALALGKLESDFKFSTCLAEKSELKKKIDRLLHSRLEDRLNWQMMMAQNLLRDAGLDDLKTEYKMEDLVKIAAYLANYQIVVWSLEGQYQNFTMKMKLNPNGRQFIGLFYYEDQYESIDWRRGYPGYRFCYACSTYGEVLGHKIYCKPVCRKCGDKLGWRCVGIFCDRCKALGVSSS